MDLKPDYKANISFFIEISNFFHFWPFFMEISFFLLFDQYFVFYRNFDFFLFDQYFFFIEVSICSFLTNISFLSKFRFFLFWPIFRFYQNFDFFSLTNISFLAKIYNFFMFVFLVFFRICKNNNVIGSISNRTIKPYYKKYSNYYLSYIYGIVHRLISVDFYFTKL